MAKRFQHVAIVGKHQARGIRPILEEIADFLMRQGLDVSLESETALNTGMTAFESLTTEELGTRCDLAIVVGGDGTMLGFAREMARHGTPLVGINQGRLGFITDISLEKFQEALAPILDGDFETEKRSMLEGAVWRDGESIFEGLALNDVVVSRGATASMVELRVDVGDEFVANMRADGIIVASPTGSTAYALSAGGPIMHPSIGGWLLVPIASHTLSNRPIVLPDTGEVRMEIVAGRDASVNFDMQSLASLLHGDRITVRRSAHQVCFLHPKGWSYYATLRRKLRWYEGVS
ncbi:NAD kinase [Paucibacter sp. DJ1R-11]|jgi:NAD+ kinase|uniref:NAD kinase n=1 Tax=unclassified Roseateles TaxID=2626991 RepID=UPI0021E4337C|nr:MULTISPECIES: NAD kinase [unclassified Roseateles]MCV2365735.1 NAD kinase [Paucibacter sp. DJ1R-11]MCV2420167.1 NAD kinase [Paucibacter sp. DJ4R-1]MCV2436906.1 NAD kinase [Paucibacter sp. DJ2R-2]